MSSLLLKKFNILIKVFIKMFSMFNLILGTDPEDALRNAFAMFDPQNKRYLEDE